MLGAPVVDAQSKELIGVVQLINTLSGEPFPQAMEEGLPLLCGDARDRAAAAAAAADHDDQGKVRQPGSPTA
jgi:hypothetical protein